jgi:hypothetical protein
MSLKIVNINLVQIITDDYFRITDVLENNSLAESIKSVGLLSPLIIQPLENDSYRLVTGFKRYACLRNLDIKTIPVVIENKVNLELFKTAIFDNLAIRFFNPIEISTIINKLESQFAVEKSEIIKTWLPILGFGRNPKIYDLYKPLFLLNENWKQALRDETVALETAILVGDSSEENKNAFLELIQNLRLGKNKQREIWGLLVDVSRIRNQTLIELLETKEIVAILTNDKLTPHQKSDRLKAILWEKRYPRYSIVKSEFENLLAQAKLPPDMHLQPPAFFEGEKFQLNISFTSQQDLKTKSDLISNTIDNNLIDKMTSLT